MSMSYPIEMDVIRRIQNDEGMRLDVRPWPEVPSVVCIQAVGEEEEKYYGFKELVLPTKVARLIGEALIKCADECDEYV